MDFSGNFNDDLRFEYEDGTDVYQSCAVPFLGDFWIFGGESGKKRQVNLGPAKRDFFVKNSFLRIKLKRR